MLEESLGVLRTSRPGTLGCYYIGSLPFVLVLIYFLADVTQSAFAAESLLEGSAGVAAAFIWMKCWHAVFAGRLMDQLCGQAPEPWGIGRVCRVAAGQAAIQPWGLFLIPTASLAFVPLPWVYAFFQNACVYGDERTDRSGPGNLAKAWRQAAIWPKQNIVGMLALILFGSFVIVNISHAIVLPPYLAKTFLDIDTVFTQGGFSEFNTTFLLIVGSLGYLCVDPLVKAFYTLRCFYGQSIKTGQDLRSELRALVVAGCLAICIVLGSGAREAGAQPAASTAGDTSVLTTGGEIPPQDLDKSLDKVLSERKYAWRIPRPEGQEDPNAERSFAARATEKVWGWIKDVVGEIRDFLFPEDEEDFSEGGSGGSGGDLIEGESRWGGLLRYIAYAAIAALGIMFAVMLWKRVRLSKTRKVNIAASAEAPAPNLEDESITADDLPESGWLDLARKLIEQGDSRLALRAMYLASLAMLADKNRISIAKFKSNMDYSRELARRCHSMPPLLEAFGRNVGVFESVWYGTRRADEQTLEEFITNQKTIGQVAADA